jgi:glycosyltransferase involved in cell wall biosynthesis
LTDRHKIAVLFSRIGPYHFARLRAAGEVAEVTGIEFSDVDGTYAWEAVVGEENFQRVTLFAGQAQTGGAGNPKSEIRNPKQIEKHQELQNEGNGDKLLLRLRRSVRTMRTIGVQRRQVYRKTAATLDQANPEVLAVPGWQNGCGLAALDWGHAARVPRVVMSESAEADEARVWWKEQVKRRIVGLCSAALAGGVPQAEYLAKLGMPRERIFLGYDVVDNEYFARHAAESRTKNAESRRQYGLPERYFLASARFVAKKNLPRLLEAYARYRESAKTLRSEPAKKEVWDLVLLGDGPQLSTLECQRATLGLEAHVLMPGFKQYRDLPRYYGLARAFVHGSTTEQWGLVVNEAMACGLPVLVSKRCGCVPDLVQEGVNGLTFDPYDVGSIADAMVRVWRMGDEELKRMGGESTRIIANWAPERFARGLKAASDCALAVGPKRGTVVDRLLLRLLMHSNHR